MTAVAVPESSEAVRRKLRRNRQLRRWSFQGFLGFAAIIWIIPLLWMLSLSLSDNDALQRDTTSLIPIEPTLSNFTTLFESGRTPSWMWNSIVVTVTTTFLTLVLSSMAGYAFARIPFRGKRIAFPLVLAGLMVPKEAMFIPLFLIFADFDQHNTYHALVLPRVAAPLGVFIMTQFFSAIPADLEEAAVIDGANRWTIFRRIMLPMSVPALTALGISLSCLRGTTSCGRSSRRQTPTTSRSRRVSPPDKATSHRPTPSAT